MAKKIYLKNPARLIIAFIVVMIMSACFMLLLQNVSSGESIPDYTTIVVREGDTLWGIANQMIENDEDVRNKIYEIKELNNIDSNIHIGQELKIRIN